MTIFPAPVTETELSDWLTINVGELIDNDAHAARLLIGAFDLLTKDGRSLNSHSRVVDHIIETKTVGESDPWSFAPIASSQAAKTLHAAFRITRKPTDEWAALLARGGMDTPLAVTRHQCPYCRRFTRASLATVEDHMTRCWKNPGLKCCVTCVHHLDGKHPEDDEACMADGGPEPEDYLFPVLHCPLWKLREF
jgi:hypothetical protein